MELSDSSLSPSSLFCSEEGSLLALSGEDDEAEEEFFVSEDEYIEALVFKETSFSSPAHFPSPSGDDISASDRSESVQWIINMKSCFGFGSQTAYLAVTYFDRFLLQRTVNEGKTWATKLLSIACLSLAAKKEERKPPFLSEYRLEGYSFSCQVIQKMELLVLDALDWRLNTVTPFAYLCYFASKLHFGLRSKNIISRAIRFIFKILYGINLINFRPSTVAAAAILAASGDESTAKLLESMTNGTGISLPEPSEIQHVFTCYNAMIHESKKEKIKSQKETRADAENLSSFHATRNKSRREEQPQ